MKKLFLSLTLAACSAVGFLVGQYASSRSGQKLKETNREYDQRQKVLDRVSTALKQEWDGSSKALEKYLDDYPEQLRSDIYALYWKIGTTTEIDVHRRTVFVDHMLSRCAIETPLLRNKLLKWLQDFHRNDFSKASRQLLNSLPWTIDFLPEVIRLIGIVELHEALPRLRKLVENNQLGDRPPLGYHNNNTWAALMALARMGDDISLTEMLHKIQQEQDIIVKVTFLLMDLAYTRRPEAYNVLRQYLNSYQRLPQVKETVPGRLAAAYVAAAFSKYLTGFPIIETDFSELQVAQARDWANAQTQWRFK
ncbi:MAG: hypothetical protein A2504_09885 [Bdellovibrionales bacterium RIFOXYD12_FULL_39_22]|nr:MAG: hypothetical protein A2404_07170 [Bdellovibrionales bacterium RIFOXYC1_FULL_39_130]OFZ74497.1 MAG: hypothetical protein A2560_03970 [Bdellovibrionales bacterium RIFOXYD1_FULL_39_84]OFZ94277.1 MAG: hypothetical protein A2504_09885 [Bdellovibrionales bacterium RIFOXYD12_FULL_39_22]